MPPQAGTMRNRWTAYAALSTALAGGVILKSLAQRPNFYSAAVYLSQSSANLMILCNLVFVTASSALLLLQQALYGPLRPIEVEQLYEKAWFAVTETCLAMTIFRGEIGAWFLVMFFSLLAGKVWGWIGEGRVEVLEQQQHNVVARGATFFYTRLGVSLILSVLFDTCMLEYTVGQVLHMARPDMMVMFGFEFAVLTITSLSTGMRYTLNLVEIAIVRKQKQKRMDAIRKERVDAAVRALQTQQEPREDGAGLVPEAPEDLSQRRTEAAEAAASQPIDEADVEVEGWEGKGRWVFYLDLTTDFCKLVTYLSFFFILLIFYGLPLHIMRDVFLTCRSFFKRIGDFLRYRNATKDMNQRYPDATEAEIGREDVCIICREEMRLYVPPEQGAARDPVAERMRPKKLPCGHVLHFSCLRSWLERQQICPTCRATVVPTPQAAQGTAGRAQGDAARVQHPHNRGNARPRVYQLGPLRIGVGAVRGNDMFEQLEQQLANLNAAPAPGPDANVPQQYGFGIRWDGMRRRAQGTHRQHRGTVDDQLNAAERQIQREVDTLQASMGELQALRNVQAQLTRIRMARQGAAAQAGQQGQVQVPQQLNPQARPVLPAVTGLAPNQQQNILQAGSDQLPPGLTLPEGWSMMPLQPMQQQQLPVQGLPPMPMSMPLNIHGPFYMPQNGLHAPFHPQPQEPQDPAGTNASGPSSSQSQDAGTQPQQMPSGNSLRDQPPTPTTAPMRPNDMQAQTRNTLEQLANSLRPPQNSDSASAPAPAFSAFAPPRPSTSAQRAPSQAQQPSPTQQNSAQNTRRPTAVPSSHVASSPRPTPTTRVPSMSNNATSTGPAQRLAPPTQSRTGGDASNPRASSTSPHRPTKSIGSSWGFSGVEDDADEEDGDTTESGEETDDQNKTPPQRNGSSARTTGQEGSGSAQRGSAKAKSATVEDLVEDPD